MPLLHVALILCGSLSCTNPTASIQPDIERFKREHKDQIVVVKDAKRNIGFAWNGDPKLRPLVLVHGSPGSWEGWARFLMNEDLRKHFQVIALDRPGYGMSAGDGVEKSLRLQADAIKRALAQNKSQLPAILVGHSFGGPVIGKYAMDHANHVAGLVFVASSVAPQLEETKWYQTAATWWLFRWMIPTDIRMCNEEIMALKQELEDMLPGWPLISQPVIIVHGEADPLVPVANVDFLIKHLSPNVLVETVRVPGLNHFIPWERPDLILAAVEKLRRTLENSESRDKR